MVCTPIYMEQLDQSLIKPSTVIKIEELVRWQLNDKKLDFHETLTQSRAFNLIKIMHYGNS